MCVFVTIGVLASRQEQIRHFIAGFSSLFITEKIPIDLASNINTYTTLMAKRAVTQFYIGLVFTTGGNVDVRILI